MSIANEKKTRKVSRTGEYIDKKSKDLKRITFEFPDIFDNSLLANFPGPMEGRQV